MHVGDEVWAYNSTTHKMEIEPVQHVWINHDHDLLDITIQPQATKVPEASQKDTKAETIHTTRKHPFLTVEHGFLPANALKPGMHVIEANGHIGVVTKWVVVPGQATMYNLTVATDHTYTVGVGQWVVHNCGDGYDFAYSKKISKQMPNRGWTDDRIQEARDNPARTVATKDTRFDSTGAQNDEPATAYYHEKGGYVVINDVDNSVVQVSNVNDPNWIAPWDPPKN